jgi:hypothetical protein
MLRAIGIGAIGAALLCIGGGVAAAEPVSLADVEQLKGTANDDLSLRLSLNAASINSVPNMAAAAIVREGFVSATATLTVEGTTEVKRKTSLTLKAQVGCQVDVSGGVRLELGPSIASSLPVLDLTPTPDEIALAPTGSVGSDVSATLLPGDIIEVVLGNAAYPDPAHDDAAPTGNLTVSVQDVQVKINKCGGPVSIRFYVQANMTTAKSFDAVEAYSDILPL